MTNRAVSGESDMKAKVFSSGIFSRPPLQNLRIMMLVLLPTLSTGFFVLSIIQEANVLWIHMFRILLAGTVGLYTNWLAIKMLFHPKDPLPLSGWQGLIPKNRSKLALAVGKEVQQRLLSPEIIAEYVKKKGMIEQLGKLVVGKLTTWIDTPESRKMVKDWLSNVIRNFSTESLDPLVDRLIQWLSRAIQDEKILLSCLRSARSILKWLLRHEKLDQIINWLVSRVASSALSDDGIVARLLESVIDEFLSKLSKDDFQKKTTDQIVDWINRLSMENREEAFDLGIEKLEKILADNRKTGKIVQSITNFLGHVASNPEVVEFVADQFVELLKKNSLTIAHLVNEAIKENSNFIVRIAKAILLPESKIVSILMKFSRDPSFKYTIQHFLLEKADIAGILKKKTTQRKLISSIQNQKDVILGFCSTKGKELVSGWAESLLQSKGFWEFVQMKLAASKPQVRKLAGTVVSSVIEYLRSFAESSDLSPYLSSILKGSEQALIDKFASRANAKKLAEFISSNRDSLYEAIDEKLRPWVLDVSSRLLSSSGFWNWVEDQVELWIPRMVSRIQVFLASEKARSFLEAQVPLIASKLNLDKIVEEQVTLFSTDELEDMINEVSGENLAGIEVFGGFLGLAAGTLTVVTECWIYAAAVFGLLCSWSLAEFIKLMLDKAKRGSPHKLDTSTDLNGQTSRKL